MRKENETPRNSDWLKLEEEIGALVEREARKRPSKMNMDLIVDGLGCLYPFNEEEDRRRAEAAWLDFQKRYDLEAVVRRQRARSKRLVVALVLLLIVALGTGLCYAFGFDIWHIAAEWTKEELLMVISPASEGAEPEKPSDSLMKEARKVWGDEVCDLLIENDALIQLPLWKPEGYEFVRSLRADPIEGYSMSFSYYMSSDEKELMMSVRCMETAELLNSRILGIEADDSLQEIYEYNGSKYYIMSNLENVTLTWISENYNVVIVGNLSFDDVYKMVESIAQSLEEQAA